MYVTGRGETGVGTVLASVLQVASIKDNYSVTICALKESNSEVVDSSAKRINRLLGTNVSVDYVKYDGTNTGLRDLANDRKFDIAIIATPDTVHYSQLKVLISLGIHCLCVKPLVLTSNDHQSLIDLLHDNNTYGAVEFHKRWDESNLYIKKILRDGAFGKLHNITFDYSQRIQIPTDVFSEWVTNTNIFQYLGVHYVDLVAWLTDAKPKRLFCHGTYGELRARGVNTWDSVHVWIIWSKDNGDEFLTQYNLSWVDSNLSPALSDQSYKILGSKGRVEVDQRDRGISLTLHDNPMQYVNPWFSELLDGPDDNLNIQGYGYKSISQFIFDCESILAGLASPLNFTNKRPTFENCLVSTRVIEIVNRCLHQNVKEVINL